MTKSHPARGRGFARLASLAIGSPPRAPSPDIAVLACLYVLEGAAVVTALALHKKGTHSILSFVQRPPGIILLVSSLAFIGAAVVVVHRLWRARSRRASRLTVLLNLVPVLIAVATGEIAVRLLAHPTSRGLAVMDTALLPRAWSDVVARNSAILERAMVDGTWVGSYLVPDDLLGWTVGRDRRSADGLAFSSREGIRSGQPGLALADRLARYRIAIVGDSFTFGLEVSYEDSWGHRLERSLGPNVQVLNFGVDGYGVDQAYLRYRRDVLSWRPDVVIFGFINHDLLRSLAVYTFVSFPDWDFPFSKPRLVTDGFRLSALNLPLLSPRTLLGVRSIRDLPFIEYDPGYDPTEWEASSFDWSYLYRFIASRYRRWPGSDERSLEEETAIRLNQEILSSFVRLAESETSTPVLVYFPSARDFRALASEANWKSLAQRMLRSGGFPHIDLTPCLMALDPGDRFVPGRPHYSPRANAAVADCLRESLRPLLPEAR